MKKHWFFGNVYYGNDAHMCSYMRLHETSIEITWLGGALDNISYASIDTIHYPKLAIAKLFNGVTIHRGDEKIQLAPFRYSRFAKELKAQLENYTYIKVV